MTQNCLQVKFEVVREDGSKTKQSVLAGTLDGAWVHIGIVASKWSDVVSIKKLNHRKVTIDVKGRK